MTVTGNTSGDATVLLCLLFALMMTALTIWAANSARHRLPRPVRPIRDPETGERYPDHPNRLCLGCESAYTSGRLCNECLAAGVRA